MQADFPVLLDACVLANFGVCDLLLRLAEPPRLYLPRWSATILDEVRRTQTEKLNWPAALADSWRREVDRHFDEAVIGGFDSLIPAMTNDPKDRHVLAAAVKGGVSLIVTFNLRHFPLSALQPLNVEVLHPRKPDHAPHDRDGGISLRRDWHRGGNRPAQRRQRMVCRESGGIRPRVGGGFILDVLKNYTPVDS